MQYQKNNEGQSKSLISLFILAVAICVVWGVFLSPVVNVFKNYEKEIHQQEQIHKKLLAKTPHIMNLEKQLTALNNGIGQSDLFISKSNFRIAESRLLNLVKVTFAKHKIRLKQSQFIDSYILAGYTIVGMQVKAKLSEDTLSKIFSLLEKAPQILYFKNIRILKSPLQKKEGILHLNMIIEAVVLNG